MHRKRNAAVIFIFITVLIDVMGVGLIIPVLPDLIRSVAECTMSEAAIFGGWLLTAYAAAQFLFAPMIGNLSDRFGRRPVLLIALGGLAVDYVIMAYAPTLGWLFAGRIVAGICGSSYSTASAYIADVSSPENRSQNFGLIGAAFGLGFIVGPALGGLLSEFGLRMPFIGAAILTALNFLFGLIMVPESLPLEKRRTFDIRRANPAGALLSIRRYPVVAGLVLALFLIYMAGQSMPSVWSYFTMETLGWSRKWVGFSLALVGLLVAIVQGGLIRFIIPKLGQQRSVYVGMSLWTLALFLFAFANSTTMMLLICIPYCLGGIAGPAIQGIMSSYMPPDEQGELQGIMAAVMSVTLVLSPYLMTHAFSWFSGPHAPVYFPGAPFLLAGIFSLSGLILAYLNFRRHA